MSEPLGTCESTHYYPGTHQGLHPKNSWCWGWSQDDYQVKAEERAVYWNRIADQYHDLWNKARGEQWGARRLLANVLRYCEVPEYTKAEIELYLEHKPPLVRADESVIERMEREHPAEMQMAREIGDLHARIERAQEIMARHNHADLMSDDEWSDVRMALEGKRVLPVADPYDCKRCGSHVPNPACPDCCPENDKHTAAQTALHASWAKGEVPEEVIAYRDRLIAADTNERTEREEAAYEVGYSDGLIDNHYQAMFGAEQDKRYEGLMAVIAASDDYIKAEADYQVSQMIGDGTTDWAAFGKAQATLFAYDKAKRDAGLPKNTPPPVFVAQTPAEATTTSATVEETPKDPRDGGGRAETPTEGIGYRAYTPRRTFDDEAIHWDDQRVAEHGWTMHGPLAERHQGGTIKQPE